MKINVSPEQFGDLTIAFLFDKLLHFDEVIPDNNDFDKIMKVMENKGMKARFMRYYIDMDPSVRMKYKRIKSTFDGKTSDMSSIVIMPEKKIEKKEKEKSKEGIIKKMLKKLLKKEDLTNDEENLLLEMFEKEEEL